MTKVTIEDLTDNILQNVITQLGPQALYTLGRTDKKMYEAVGKLVTSGPRISISQPEEQAKFQKIIERLPNLKEANFSHSLFLTNELVGFVVDHCPQIESLNLWNCLTISDSALRHISRLENLRWLNVGDNPNFTAEGLTEIVDKCNKLTHLELTLCPKVGPIGTINKLAYSIANQGLEITELICEFCPEFANDSTLFELRSGHNSRITKLVLGNGTVTDSGVDHIIASPFASALRKIDLRRNNEVTQSGYDRLHSSLNLLTELDGIPMQNLPEHDVGQFFICKRSMFGEG
ncbi:MAG: hypothetical protein EZS28_010337 [Streblomastix strix]|uniref:F-box/LRR-repeat protein 15-like leucin rich repeat domain-containing protein n=1 Tax=Streblomastix strix TaxID=222440 RepID=A0A5J4WH38_9EUKA|nr:MAG: hypothetical protein EZS28_010337 [Streblomastix strix]